MIAPPGPVLKASVPGPYTLSGRINPGGTYEDRWDITEALIPIVREELEQLVHCGCREITLDEPSMSCYGHREDSRRFVKIFAETVKPILGYLGLLLLCLLVIAFVPGISTALPRALGY